MKTIGAIVSTFVLLAVSTSPLSAADELTILSLSPSSGHVSGVWGPVPLDSTNSVEATFLYKLESVANAKIVITASGAPGNPAVLGVGDGVLVKNGGGQATARFSVMCSGRDEMHVVNLRYFFVASGGENFGQKLLEKFQPVNYFFCGPDPKVAASVPTLGGVVAGQKPLAPDITIKMAGLTIGGKYVRWGSTVALTLKDGTPTATLTSFNMEYTLVEAAGVAAGPAFVNRLKIDGAQVVSAQQPLSLLPSESKTISAQVGLPCGSHRLVLSLDDDSSVGEINEANNHFPIAYTLPCGLGPT